MKRLHKESFRQKLQHIVLLPGTKWVCCFLITFLLGGQLLTAAPSNATQSQSQQSEGSRISGKVTDDQGEPLIGVTIACKGTSRGTITDVNGKYSLEVRPSDVLVVSYVGYKRQIIPYTGQLELNIKMLPDIKSLNEVVVVGYGTQKAKNITGSIATVNMQKATELPVGNLTEALSGQIAGLSVNDGSSRPGDNTSTMQIRQVFNFSKNQGTPLPLVVIDGVIQIDPTSGLPTLDQFNMLDPSEIQSISILRDASAAIYGARGTQGVIIVTTKHGQIGAPKISYSAKFEIDNAVSFEKTLNAYQYGVFANSFLQASGVTNPTNLYSTDELNQMKTLNYNWLKEAWKPAGLMQHSINVSGGSQKATYFVGASYYTQGANLENQNYNRYTFRAGTDAEIASNLHLNGSVSANSGKQTQSFTKVVSAINDGSYGSYAGGEQADYGYLLHMPQYIPWSYNVNGTTQYVSPALSPAKVSGNATSANAIADWNYFAILNSGSAQTNTSNSYTANFTLRYDIPYVKGLSVSGQYARTYETDNNEQDAMPFTLALATNTNTLDNHLYTSSTTWKVAQNNKNSRVVYSNQLSENEQMNFFINYAGSFGKNNISAMAAAERSTQSVQNNYYEYDNPLAGAYNGASSSAGTLDVSNSYTTKTSLGTLSYFGRVNYNYADKYLAQFILRADASTKFAPANYWGLFPTLSLGWIASEEPWFRKEFGWVDYFKVRASVGETGKDNITAYEWEQLYTYNANKGLGFGSNGGSLVSGLTTNVTPTPNLRWDSTVKYDLGFDGNVLNNRLSFSLDGYFDRNTNLLTQMASAANVPITAGGAYAEQNYANLNDWGAEISINWKDKIGKVNH
ncbi:SusC/RagA family TonB-linked outer membrane protein [Microbacter margulisiae]|uniref:TonB-linked SusC/RagA family outer membrane protein n=1 Tax=Microbacter margulisiae TaxID=1350067 RepID=A0A7W5DQQ8_9PORP|nr:SusC/RagA family TonB-linked outer membrane protein [Microbacter margulisiae]MBB3186983.1 TonB-linked SusC/RagA family outer membrane protein [Microbacter margulisiae]